MPERTDPKPPRTGLTWLELARHIAAMTPEQRRRPVYFCDDDTGHVHTPGLVLAEGDLPDESDPLLHRDASVIPGGSFYLTQNVTTPDAPAHPADGLVLVALDLDDGEEPPADFETATGIFYELSEVEDVGDGRRMAWYFQQGPHPIRRDRGMTYLAVGRALTTADTGGGGHVTTPPSAGCGGMPAPPPTAIVHCSVATPPDVQVCDPPMGAG